MLTNILDVMVMDTEREQRKVKGQTDCTLNKKGSV